MHYYVILSNVFKDQDTHTHTYIHTYIYIYTYIHTYILRMVISYIKGADRCIFNTPMCRLVCIIGSITLTWGNVSFQLTTGQIVKVFS